MRTRGFTTHRLLTIRLLIRVKDPKVLLRQSHISMLGRNFANMQSRDTPPHSGPDTPETQALRYSPTTATDGLATPTSLPSVSLTPTPKTSGCQASKNPTQDEVEADLLLKRHQQDLLVLTSLNDNSTLHWRPSWFKQVPFNDSFWTLHNPPDVVTEKLPSSVPQSKDYYTRRMRQQGDRPPIYIETWDHWDRYCELYGVPLDFLSEDQVGLMRLGLPRTEKGALCGNMIAIRRYESTTLTECSSAVVSTLSGTTT
jgi:hypothetical protein